MLRYIDITLENTQKVEARACIVQNKAGGEVTVERVMAVDFKESKVLQMCSGDFGIVIYNELNLGFMITWKQFEEVQTKFSIQEEDYEAFLDDFCNSFSDSILDYINAK